MNRGIAKRIVVIRKGNNLTQAEFAKRLNTTRPKIAAYELNRVNFDSAFLDYICKTFNVNYEWLTTGQGEMYVVTKQTFLEKLSDEYGLSFTAQKIIECYLNLDDLQRDTVDDFILSIADSLQEPVPEIKEASAVDKAIDKTTVLYRAANSKTHTEHEIITDGNQTIEKLQQLPPVTDEEDF